MTTTPKQSRLSGAISVTIAQAVVLFLGFITHPVIGSLLGPAAYGIYGVVLSMQSIIGIFLTQGIPSAVSRYVAQDEKHAASILKQALKLQIIAAASLALATALAAPILSRLLGDTTLTSYLLFVPLILLMQAFYPIFIQFFSGLHLFNRQAALTTLYALAKLIGAVLLLLVFDIYGAFAGFAVGGFVAGLFGWIWTKKYHHGPPKKLARRQFLTFAGSYVLVLVGLQFIMSLDLFMVKAFLKDDVQAGYYNAAVTLSRISYFLLQALTFVLLPSIASLTKPGASQKNAARFISDTLRYLIALIVPAITLAATTSKDLLQLFFLGTDFIPAAPALSILMIGLGALSFYLLITSILAGAGQEKRALATTGVLIIISALLGTFLIPRFGLIGAAWQTTITALLGLISLGAYTFHHFHIPFPLKSTINIIIATCIAILPTYIWSLPVIMLPLQYLVLIGIYLLALYALQEFRPADWQRLASVHPAFSRFTPKK